MRREECINILGEYLGVRDIHELTCEALQKKYGINQADIFVLFGGTILEGGRVLAQAIRNNVAKKYIIVGGAGHTTDDLRYKMHEQFATLATNGETEAEIFSDYLFLEHGLKVDYLERKSTNCGNNITYLLQLIKENELQCNSIILAQDATMQRRMDATLRKYVDSDINVINYATYQAKVEEKDNQLAFQKIYWGMWDMERYITLLMGEIPRLTDDENGYGPNGKDFISHVDIPENVTNAFNELKDIYADSIREANSLYAGK